MKDFKGEVPVVKDWWWQLVLHSGTACLYRSHGPRWLKCQQICINDANKELGFLIKEVSFSAMKCSKEPKLPKELKEKESPCNEAEKHPSFSPSSRELFGVSPEGHRSLERLNKINKCSGAPSSQIIWNNGPNEHCSISPRLSAGGSGENAGLCPTSAFVLFLSVSQHR